MKIFILSTAILFIINGCNNDEQKNIKEEIKQSTSVYTVQYYLEHKDLRRVRIKECHNLIKMSNFQLKDCNNVETAELNSKRNKLIDL